LTVINYAVPTKIFATLNTILKAVNTTWFANNYRNDLWLQQNTPVFDHAVLNGIQKL